MAPDSIPRDFFLIADLTCWMLREVGSQLSSSHLRPGTALVLPIRTCINDPEHVVELKREKILSCHSCPLVPRMVSLGTFEEQNFLGMQGFSFCYNCQSAVQGFSFCPHGFTFFSKSQRDVAPGLIFFLILKMSYHYPRVQIIRSLRLLQMKAKLRTQVLSSLWINC